MDTTDLGDTSGSDRRRFLRAGLTGAAVSAALPFLARQATAQASGIPSAAATDPPRRPTEADRELLNFAGSVELAAVDLYSAALATGGHDTATTEVLTTFRDHHRSYGQALGGMLGPATTGQRNEMLMEALEAGFASSADALQAAYTLEDTAVATHTELLGLLEGTEGAALIASILIVAAQHAVVLAEMSGAAGLDDLDTLLTTQSDALVPNGPETES